MINPTAVLEWRVASYRRKSDGKGRNSTRLGSTIAEEEEKEEAEEEEEEEDRAKMERRARKRTRNFQQLFLALISL